MTHTAHIEACRDAFESHCARCLPCLESVLGYGIYLCETGARLFDAYANAINNHPDLEQIELSDRRQQNRRGLLRVNLEKRERRQ